MITEAGIKAAIKRTGTASGSVELKDGGSGRGEGRLALVVRRSGERVTAEWFAAWWRDGKRKKAKLGAYPAVSLAAARRDFRENYAAAISAGRDPSGPKARRERAGVTVADMFAAYVADMRSSGKKSADFVECILLGGKDNEGGSASAIGRSVRAADVTVDDIRDHLAEIYDRGAVCMADTTRAYIHAAFAWAMKSANSYKGSAAKVNWGIAFNPCSAIPADGEAKRVGNRYLTPAELRALWAWLSAPEQEGVLSAAAKLHICTGQRVSEILAVSEAIYDRGEKMVEWPKTKNGAPHAIPLPKQAIEILEGLPANKSGLFFPSRNRPDHPASVRSYEELIRRYLKDYPDVRRFTPRDIRRTWKTLAGASGVSKEIRDRLQHHTLQDVSSKNYDRWTYLPEKRAGMTVWASYLDRILEGELDNPVTRLQVAGDSGVQGQV